MHSRAKGWKKETPGLSQLVERRYSWLVLFCHADSRSRSNMTLEPAQNRVELTDNPSCTPAAGHLVRRRSARRIGDESCSSFSAVLPTDTVCGVSSQPTAGADSRFNL